MFSLFKSYYVDDTAFILLSRGEVVAASKLIVSHFRRFGLTIHTGSKRKNEKSKTEAIHFPRPGQESSAADMEDIEIDDDRFMSFCVKFKYVGSYYRKGSTRTGGEYNPATSFEVWQCVYVHDGLLMYNGCKWYCRRCLGNTGEYRRRAWPSWFVRTESAAGCPGGARLDELGSLLSAWLLCGPCGGHCCLGDNCGGLDDYFVIAHGRRGLSA
jgi:hypothetical protein